MPESPKRLVGPVYVPSPVATIYTVPANTTAVVRNIHITCAVTGTFSIGVGGVGNNQLLYGNFVMSANTAFDWSGFLVLAAGEILQGVSSPANGMTITISGIEVS